MAMTKRADRSMLLTLSQEETKMMRDIIKPRLPGPFRASIPTWVLCTLGVAFLVALTAFGVMKPDLAMEVVQLAGRMLAMLM